MKDYELEKAAVEYANSIAQHDHNKVFSIDDFKAGANWRLEQFEKGKRIYFNPHTAKYSHEKCTEDDIEYIAKEVVERK